jgi:hypothetical protein
VNDFFSTTANHFINAGVAGFVHFHFLLSTILKNVNFSSIDELSTAWSCILYKGHKKDRDSDRSYRNISTCPFLAKCADIYVGRLSGPGWAACQAETQFQGAGSSHELAALLLTETITYSVHVNKKAAYVLLLDAKSAFDNVVRECAMRSAYLAGTDGHALLYLDTRMASRRTFPEWDKVLMGPVSDSLGVEQGGVNSDKIYKLCNNNQLTTAQQSQLGVDCGAAVVSAIGQADDTALVSDSIHKLAGLVHLAEEYCAQYHVTLVPEKTKLLAFSPRGEEACALHSSFINPISVAGDRIPFCKSAEHVGILRTTEGGNMPHILDRITAHRRAVASTLHCGLAKGHRGNPVAGLRLHRIYGAPVLLSGVSALVLSAPELAALHAHYRLSIRQLLRLPVSTPECFVMMMAGTLPATALLHMQILSLLGMIGRLGPECILNRIGRQSLLEAVTGSWFVAARRVTVQYGLTDPLLVLQQAPTRRRWKAMVRSKVIDWWEQKFRGEAEHLASLRHFKPHFFSLTHTHNTFVSAGSPYEVRRATTVSRMLSGRYITCHRTRHWDRSNPDGLCRLCPGPGSPTGDLPHQLLACEALAPARARAARHWAAYMATRPYLAALVPECTLGPGPVEAQLAFLLDPSSCPAVISAAQQLGPTVLTDCHLLGRVWCHGTHVLRIKLLRLHGFIKK